MTIAAKHFDPIVGIDTHVVMMPSPAGAPIPVPLPNPYVGMLLDPLDYVPGVGAKVWIHGLPRAQAGSAGIQITPHVPLGGPLAPLPTGESSVFMGSSSVAFDGDAQAFGGIPVLSCHTVGLPAPFRLRGAAVRSAVLPMSTLLAIPMAAPVNIGGAPVLSLQALPQRVLFAGLGKMLRKAQRRSTQLAHALRAVSRRAQQAGAKLARHLRLGDPARNRIARAACTVTGHPVDVATGKVFTVHNDLTLPGPIPCEFERVWYSSSTYRGPLGHGWHHRYDAALYVRDDVVLHRACDGRLIAFPALSVGQTHFLPSEQLTLSHESSGYSLRNRDRLRMQFGARGRADGELSLLSIHNPAGEAIVLQHDARGRMVELRDSAGRRLRFVYDAADRICELHTPAPHDGQPAQCGARYHYDELGNLHTVTDALGQSEHYEYRKHLLVRETDRNGLSFYFAYDADDENAKCSRTWGDGGIYDHHLVYSSDGSATAVTNSLGHTTRHEHREGLVHCTVDARGGVTRTSFDADDRVIARSDALGNTTQCSYDQRSRLTAITQPDGARTQMFYDEHDQLVELVDALGGHWHYTYDEYERLTSRTDPLGQRVTPGGAEEHCNYDALGRLISQTDAAGLTQRYEYDANHRVTKQVEPDGTTREFTYDAEGQLVRVRDALRDLRFQYSGLGCLVARSEAGTTVHFEFDTEEQLISVTNEHGHTYRFELDATGAVVGELGFDGALRCYERDLAGQVTQLVRASGRTSRHAYDRAGRLLRSDHSDGSFEQYTYRPDGALTSATNADTCVSWVRDALGRVLREEQAEHWVASKLDARGLRVRMRSSLGADQRIDRSALGDVTGLSHQRAGHEGGFELQITRDGLGREVERWLPGNVCSHWRRDRFGRPALRALTLRSHQLHTRSYDWHTRLQLQHSSDSLFGAASYGHDVLGKLASTQQPGAAPELRMPDAVGNLFRREDRSDREYGPAGQLLSVQADAGHSTSYQYDADGNLICKTSTRGETWRYTWRADGLLQSVLRPDGALVTFAYDALGRRIRKTYRGQTTRWVWDGDVPLHEWVEGELQAVVADAGNSARTAAANLGKRAAELVRRPERGPPQRGTLSEPITWVFDPESFAPAAKLLGDRQLAITTDHLGTPNALVDDSGAIVWSAELDSWGQLRPGSGERQTCPFRWPGQYEDTETGLYYNRFRYYDPDSGQYVSQDPIGLAGGLALHEYVQDPLSEIDPLGLATCSGVADAEIYYRTMSKEHFKALKQTGRLPATGETFISPTRAFSARYDGVLVQF
ncbi:MAG: hypothetical protein RL701_499, partial [Pseudomonadota bacterium]